MTLKFVGRAATAALLFAIVIAFGQAVLPAFGQETPLPIAQGSAEIEWTHEDGSKTPGAIGGVYIGEDQVAHCEKIATNGTVQNQEAAASARAMLQKWFPFHPATVKPKCVVRRWVEQTNTFTADPVAVPAASAPAN